MISLIDVITVIDRLFFVWPRALLNPLFPAFTPFEKKLLSLIKEQMPNDKADILNEHIKAVNSVSRDGGDRQIIFLKIFIYREIWARPCYFEPREGENKLLRFKVFFNSGETLNGSLITEGGVFLGINFGSDADDYRKRTDFTVKVKTHF